MRDLRYDMTIALNGLARELDSEIVHYGEFFHKPEKQALQHLLQTMRTIADKIEHTAGPKETVE